MTVMIIEHSNDSGIHSVELATDKHHAYVGLSALGVSVLVKPLSSRLFGQSHTFATFADAADAYKLPAAKAMIAEAATVLA